MQYFALDDPGKAGGSVGEELGEEVGMGVSGEPRSRRVFEPFDTVCRDEPRIADRAGFEECFVFWAELAFWVYVLVVGFTAGAWSGNTEGELVEGSAIGSLDLAAAFRAEEIERF